MCRHEWAVLLGAGAVLAAVVWTTGCGTRPSPTRAPVQEVPAPVQEMPRPTQEIPAPVILDVPAMVLSASIPGRSGVERQEGPLYWSECRHPDFESLEVAALEPGGPPCIVIGYFLDPVTGRSRAMQMLGTGDAYTVVSRAPGSVSHQGWEFAEFDLLREPNSDEYNGFSATTWAGAAAKRALRYATEGVD